MDITENQLSLGQVKSIRSNGGKTVDYIELLFSPTTKAQFCIDKEKNVMMFSVKDIDLSLPSLDCGMDKKTIRDLIVSLKDLYNELPNESEVK